MTKRQRNILDMVDVTGIHLTKIKSLARAIVLMGDNQQDPHDMITLAYMANDVAEDADATLRTFFEETMGRKDRRADQSLASRRLPEAARS